MRFIIYLSFLISAVPLLASASVDRSGRLVIVGGALSYKQDDIFETLLQSGKSLNELRAVVIPAASSRPSHYGELFKAELERRGLNAERVTVLPLAVKDDRSTPELDESLWSENANDPKVVANIREADVVWFTGGDQSRITKVLGDYENPSPSLLALYAMLRNGGTIGGTSAGAAIMSRTMIVGGSSEDALFRGVARVDSVDQEGGALLIGKGMEFFKAGIIDQHFDAKARLGRLIMATSLHGDALEAGFGIDENTALVVDLKSRTGTVAGSGRMTVVKPSQALDADQLPNRICGVRLSSLGAGDRIDLSSLQVTPASDKSPTVEAEYYSIAHPSSSGVLSSYGSLNQILSVKLIDNAEANEAISFLIHPEQKKAYRLRFSKGNTSRGYWTYRNGQENHYTITGIELCLEPIQISIIDAP